MKSIWYKNPAENFGEAISVGNGRIGATVFGGTGHEKIYLISSFKNINQS